MQRQLIYQTFSHIPTLETERLILRRIDRKDCTDMFEYSSLESVTEYLTWNPHKTISYTGDYLRYLSQRYSVGDFYDWGVIIKSTGKMIGTCGFTRFDFSNDSAEIGYVINPIYQGHGYATEAAECVLQFGFDTLKLHRIEAEYIDGNQRSRALMERIGMTFEGLKREAMLIKGQYRTIGVCSILESEYREKQKKKDARAVMHWHGTEKK